MPYDLTWQPAPTSEQPERLRLHVNDWTVAHVMDSERAQWFTTGWNARMGLERRLAPVLASKLLRDQWFWGWDWANGYLRRPGRKAQAA